MKIFSVAKAKINMSRLSPNMHAILKTEVIELLQSKQIYSALDFIKADAKVIEKSAQLTFKEVLEVRKELIAKYSAHPRNAFDYYRYILSNSAIIQTGIKNLDTLLEGGLFTANIYEVCGLPATGKTLFCLTLLKNIISHNMRDNVYYLDTKRDFYVRKLKQMLNNNLNKVDLVEALNKVLVKRVHTRHDLVNSLFEIKQELQEGLKLRVIIVDSLPALHLQSSNHAENNSFLNHTANILRYLSVEYNIVIVVTNLITLWNESSDFKSQEVFTEKVSCGGYWYNVPNVRLKMERVQDNKCKIILLKTWKIMPQVCECLVDFSDEGLQ